MAATAQTIAKKSRAKPEGRLLVAVQMASAAGLLEQPKTKHINAKVQPGLFEAAARRAGSSSPAVVIEAALAALATQDDLGTWLASNWGSLAEVDPAVLDELTL